MNRFRLTLTILVSAVLLSATSAAFAQSRYSVSVMRSCIQGAGFDANFANLGTNTTRTQMVDGTLVLNPDGSGSLVPTTMTLTLDPGRQAPGQQAMHITTGRCAVRHTTLSNGDIRIILRNCTWETIAGRNVGDFGTVSGSVIRARPTANGELLQLSTFTQGTIEEVTYNIPTPGTTYRICQRVGTAVLKP